MTDYMIWVPDLEISGKSQGNIAFEALVSFLSERSSGLPSGLFIFVKAAGSPLVNVYLYTKNDEGYKLQLYSVELFVSKLDCQNPECDSHSAPMN